MEVQIDCIPFFNRFGFNTKRAIRLFVLTVGITSCLYEALC